MDKISMPWYPKDWWTSDTFFTLNIPQRYVYLELLFMMWMSGESRVKNDRIFIGRKLSVDIDLETWQGAVDRLVIDGDFLSSENVKRRRRPDDARAENGKLGGRPSKEEKPKNKPSEKPSSKPGQKPEITCLLEQKENITELEPNTKGFNKPVGMDKGANGKTPSPTPQPLWRVGLRDGLVLQEVWGKYGEFLAGKIAGMNRARMEAAIVNFWPYEIGGPYVKKIISAAPEKVLRGALEDISEALALVGKIGPGKATLSTFENFAEFLKHANEYHGND